MAIISYIIAEDHKIFRKGLYDALCGDHRLKRAGEATNGLELLELLKTAKADVLLLDLKMPEMDGIEAAKIIRMQYPQLKIIVITMYDDESLIVQMLEIGVNGYLTKEVDPEEIIKAVHAVYEKDYYFNEIVSKILLKNLVDKNKTRPNEVVFTEKEKEVLRLICQQRTTAEIANTVFLSQRTIEGIRSTMIEKIGARNTVGLVIYAMRNNIV
jgi:DNA-binding NarL/FixJ family response regulator